jgi:hypothetical protein
METAEENNSFIYYFIYSSFNNVVGSLEYVRLNDRIITEQGQKECTS